MADNNIDVFKMFAVEDRLDGDNYPMWAYMMQHVLVSKGVWNIVLVQGIDDAQAHALIALSVKRTITPHIRSTKSAKQAWDILAGLYAGRNEAKIALLRKELESKIMNEEDDMDTFLAGIKDINEQLISAGEIISDNSLVTSFACKLAKHRKSNVLEAKDVLLHLSTNWDLSIPGFCGDEYHTHKKTAMNEVHKQRLALVKKSIAAQQSGQDAVGTRASGAGQLVNTATPGTQAPTTA
ncbi:hypothetical protein L7F22_056317 [Adiantum nelumboides]|nr:hypothetical protein [Adiantum nelumboides]